MIIHGFDLLHCSTKCRDSTKLERSKLQQHSKISRIETDLQSFIFTKTCLSRHNVLSVFDTAKMFDINYVSAPEWMNGKLQAVERHVPYVYSIHFNEFSSNRLPATPPYDYCDGSYHQH